MGCPKNVNDSEVAAGILAEAGHTLTDDISRADALMVNTCGFIDDAKRESIEKIFSLAKSKNEGAVLIVSGCLSERYGEKLYRQMPEADIFIGVNDYASLPEIIERLNAERGKSFSASGKRMRQFSGSGKEYAEMPQRRLGAGTYTTTLKIAEGCDNRCAYCVIPAIRGNYRSRAKMSILQEASRLAELGCKELVIVAQDVTAYGTDLYGKPELPELLRALCGIGGIRWIRLMYCYEDRITDELIEMMKSQEKICKYIDMPIQHCSDKILKLMNRRSTKNSIISTVERLRSAIPDIHIRSTVITGLPGEGREEFSELLEFIEEMRFERLGAFAYSKEEGTPAAKMKPQVRKEAKMSRKDAVMLAQLGVSRMQNAKKIGQTLEVLVEGEDAGGAFFGRSRYDAPEIDNSVIFTSEKNCKPGDIVNVKITDAFDYDLSGREVDE